MVEIDDELDKALLGLQRAVEEVYDTHPADRPGYVMLPKEDWEAIQEALAVVHGRVEAIIFEYTREPVMPEVRGMKEEMK
jgi:hypothetical protein